MADQPSNKKSLNDEALEEIYGSDEQAKPDELLALESNIAHTFTTEAGAAVLEWLENTYGDQISFDPDNQYKTAFNEGQRHVVLTIKRLMEESNG